jgi:hypothetical protein
MWCPYVTKKFNCKKIIFMITILGGLVCFHMKCWDLPNCNASSLHALGIIGKSLMSRVYQVGFIMFWLMVEKLLNVE